MGQHKKQTVEHVRCPKCYQEGWIVGGLPYRRWRDGYVMAWCESCHSFIHSSRGKGRLDLTGQLFLPFPDPESFSPAS
jgi:hypothetical protein